MKKIIAFGIGFTPMLLLAAQFTDVSTLFTTVQTWMKTLSTMIFALAILYFLYSVFNFMRSAGDEKVRGEARTGIIWSIVGLTVMASIYGLISFLGSSTIGVGGTAVSAPTLTF